MNATQSTQGSSCHPRNTQYPEADGGEKETRVGCCQARDFDGEVCSKQSSSTPPNLQLCATYRKDIVHDAPCYFLRLPTELRQEIFRYLMPERPIDSLVMYKSDWNDPLRTIVVGGSLRTIWPTSLLNLLFAFNREILEEIRDVFYNTATFTIDISRVGVTLCGRRILRPSRRDSFFYRNDDQTAIDRFIRCFAWKAVRNYHVSISVGRQEDIQGHRTETSNYDGEVELYDLRDYVAVVVSGVLAKTRQLCNLQVSVKINDPDPYPLDALGNTKIFIGPFERLRCVRNPRLVGVFHDQGLTHTYSCRIFGHNDNRNRCVEPSLPSEPVPIFTPGMPDFDAFAADWERCLASEGPTNIIPASPMTKLFLEFKSLHNKLAEIMPTIVRHGRQCFLHRARVAREHEDIAGFRAVSAELLACWRHHLQVQELERQEVDIALQRMDIADIYPRYQD